MARFFNAIRVSAPPERAWAIVGDLNAVHRWVPGVTTCRLEGTLRICNDGQILEEITEYSDDRRSYRYLQTKVPLPVRTSQGRLTVKGDGSGSRIEWEAEVEALDPSQEEQLVPMIDGYYKQAFESLRQFIESTEREAAR